MASKGGGRSLAPADGSRWGGAEPVLPKTNGGPDVHANSPDSTMFKTNLNVRKHRRPNQPVYRLRGAFRPLVYWCL